MRSHDTDIDPPNSNQFIFKSKKTFGPNSTKYLQVIPENRINKNRETTGRHICSSCDSLASKRQKADMTSVSHIKWGLVYPPTGAAGGGAAPDLFQGPDTLSPLTRMISPSSPTSSFSYSSSSFSSLQTVRQGLSRDPTVCYEDFFFL